ncbi:DUF5107 domain-containing protein [Aestuariimicrobium sp. T2.26MG-19.2B]|uniref:DUF5107 domain-containing protein n=1 Tax=Aestuariimicrobium sp. T2.26MG-19.2B TaxID=3040679 RepID=UPI002477B128|nr:DUF5107 domain-containing protein [Aestuariimicrobium sp. T2.26MG-19.2B]CAI9406511.1 hypothetical protein AESSP_01640 [Aestuariimicrobium sp. T2.26MG-19.2B]
MTTPTDTPGEGDFVPHDAPGLPTRPQRWRDAPVAVWEEPLTLPTYHPDSPSPHPAFLGNRVYQGSSGAVHPMPLYESIEPVARPRDWRAVHLENDWLRIVVLPELGGRIHIGYDRVRDHDFFHRQDVIKPALVGLAGPWIAGGVEFNWPQHHRPATFLPTDVEIEHGDDGSVTVWCSDHDPLTRMKGMHGIRLAPDRAVVEVLARVHNRTDVPQTFLWWANVAARVDENYQSFFPTDVHFVADHANRATTGFPAADRPYYGVDYPARVTPQHPDADRLDWYRNIPVPTSYMVLETDDEYFGGYDHRRGAGFVHWASREVSPGKKQWTWGNHEFGHAWDRALTDDGGHYIELMAGVFTNNQPDFSYLQPGETKTFSQLWYPIGELGPVQQANPDAAASLVVEPLPRGDGDDDDHAGAELDERRVTVRVQSTRALADCSVELLVGGEGTEVRQVEQWHLGDLDPAHPVTRTATVPSGAGVRAIVRQGSSPLLTVLPVEQPDSFEVPPPAVEPAPPEQVASNDELWFIGSHLEQYRHATRSPETWWSEALRRDPGDFRCNVGMGLRRFRAADFEAAERHLNAAVARSNTHNLNPRDAEGHYLLGLTLMRLGRLDQAWTILARAGWDGHWWMPAQLAMARIELLRRDDQTAVERLLTLVQRSPEQLEARDLAVVGLRRLGLADEATDLLDGTLALDPLDAWARVLRVLPADTAPTSEDLNRVGLDPVTWLDVAKEFKRCGAWDEALAVLAAGDRAAPVEGMTGVAPLLSHHRAHVLALRSGEHSSPAVAEALAEAVASDPRWALPIDHDDVAALRWAVDLDPGDWLAHSMLGSWNLHWRRVDEAQRHWSASWTTHPTAVVGRCLGLLAHNHDHDPARAWQFYERARALAPDDAQLLSELDQLAQLRSEPVASRLARLDRYPELVGRRHDLAARHAGLKVVIGRADEALAALARRQFQPWEGGEGQVLATWEAAALAATLQHPHRALALIDSALRPPASLGEDRHLLANPAHLWLARGDAHARQGERREAQQAWRRAAEAVGDFREMATTPHSDLSFFRIVALRRLGEGERADDLTADLADFTDHVASAPARIDHFATSLPQLLLFVRPPEADRDDQVAVLRAQLELLAGVTDGPALQHAKHRLPHHLLLWWSAQVSR